MSINMNDVSTDIKAVRGEDVFCHKFKNSGSQEMSVNGSVTPVEFSLSDLPAGQKIIIQSLSFVIGADVELNLNQFGNVAELVNGVIFNCGGGVITIKDNSDIFLISSNWVINTVARLVGLDYTAIIGRWDFTDTFGGNAPVIVNADDFKITVQDDLSGLPLFRVSCHGILVEG